jgi:hypothetical protein
VEITAKRIRELGKTLNKKLIEILNDVGQPRIEKIKARTPVRDGHLRGSIHLVPAKKTRQGVEVAWAAGGVASAYARRQHEDLSYKHTVGQALFIRSVIYDDARYMRTELSDALKRLFS